MHCVKSTISAYIKVALLYKEVSPVVDSLEYYSHILRLDRNR